MLLRRALLWASDSPWLRERATRARVVRRSVARFMPGERMEDALEAAARLKARGIAAMFTRLGEGPRPKAGANERQRPREGSRGGAALSGRIEEAEEVGRHYLRLIDLARQSGLDAQISVKPTQLGYDQDVEVCHRQLVTLFDRAAAAGMMLWLDMESSPYVDGTLALFRRLRERGPGVGVALQSYLYRTERDLASLLPLGAAIRLVKGAYLEPASVAFPRKADVDANYARLAARLLQPDGLPPGSLVHLATHDIPLQDRLRRLIAERGLPRERFEIAMLYGIRSARQAELARAGVPVRCLVSYGEHWFPWYMRRLAERPANVWFVVRNALPTGRGDKIGP